MPASLSGSRIRAARLRAGISQVGLAEQVGISPSYLNLIEHNRRRIGGRVLGAIADALRMRPSELAEGGSPTTIVDLKAAASEDDLADPSTAESFAGRFPDWAALLLRLARRVRDQDAAIAALSDRLTHDPFLSETVHAMLSHITAIRSTAGILAQVENIPAMQQRGFHESIDAESVRLSDTAQALADYLGATTTRGNVAATAEETLDHFLSRHRYHFDDIDREAEAAAAAEGEFDAALNPVIDAIIDAEPTPISAVARSLVRRYLMTYAADARTMPLEAFAGAARTAGWDPGVLSRRFKCGIDAVFRRLAVLHRPKIEAPRFGLIVVTASGYPLHRHPRPDFALPRHGNMCPLWPLYRGFTQPGQLLFDRIEHDTGHPLITLTHAAPRAVPEIGMPPDLAASMLFVAETESPFPPVPAAASPVGTSCRICARQTCAARVEAHLL